MKKINGIVLACSLAIAALFVFTLTARAAVVFNVNQPVTEVVFNTCNGETVTFTGFVHDTLSVTLDGSGGFHMSSQTTVHLAGTGDQGNSYEGNNDFHDTLNGRVGLVQTVPFTLTAISKGSAPNFELHSLSHFTVNANGTVTSFVNNFTTSCPG